MTYGFGLAGEGVQAFGEGVRQARQEKLDAENLHVERLYKRYELAKDARNRAQQKAAWRAQQRAAGHIPQAYDPEDDRIESEYNMAEQYENSILDEMSNVLGGGGKKAQAKGTKAFLQKLFGLQEEYDKSQPARGAAPIGPRLPSQGIAPAVTTPPSEQQPGPGQRFQLPTEQSDILQRPAPSLPRVQDIGSVSEAGPTGAVSRQVLASQHAPRVIGRAGEVPQLRHYEPTTSRVEQEEFLLPTPVPPAPTKSSDLARADAAATTAQPSTTTQPATSAAQPYQWGPKAATDLQRAKQLSSFRIPASRIPIPREDLKGMDAERIAEAKVAASSLLENLSGYVQHVLQTPTTEDDSLQAARRDPTFAQHLNRLEILQASGILPVGTLDNFLRRHWPQEYAGRGAVRGPSASEEQWAAFKVPPEQRTPEQKRIIEAAKEQKSLGSLAGSVPREQWDAFKTPPERRTPEQKAIIEGYKEQRKIAGPGISIITGVDPDTLEETIFAVTRTQPPTATPVQGIKPRPGAIPQAEIEEDREISTPDPRFPGTDLRTTRKVRVASARKIIQYYERNKSKISVRTLANMARPEIFRDNPEDLQVLRDYIRNMHKKSGTTEFPNETEIDLEGGAQPEPGSRFSVPPRPFGR